LRLSAAEELQFRKKAACVRGDAQDGSWPPKNVLNISPATS